MNRARIYLDNGDDIVLNLACSIEQAIENFNTANLSSWIQIDNKIISTFRIIYIDFFTEEEKD